MRAVTLGLIVGLSLCSTAMAATPDVDLMAPIHQFIDSFNKGDAATAGATHSATSDLSITDEVPPHLWRGSKAFGAWAADLEANSKKLGITDEMVELGAPTRIETNGKTAYVVVPAVYTFKQKGVAMRESAQMTYALKKDAAGWLIHAWTWTGPKPGKAPAK
ncbi:MAG TPA: nuclear transport factor 2 family protein [Steroidobacteraceae bacterium]|nr:nuclear transport factor 2 family protein [Steroidobacteraceae bacterium]